jgi:hypothetical protein
VIKTSCWMVIWVGVGVVVLTSLLVLEKMLGKVRSDVRELRGGCGFRLPSRGCCLWAAVAAVPQALISVCG